MNGEQSFRALLSAIILRAIDDLRHDIQPHRAMHFIHGSYCESLCYFLDMPIEKIREKAAALYSEN